MARRGARSSAPCNGRSFAVRFASRQRTSGTEPCSVPGARDPGCEHERALHAAVHRRHPEPHGEDPARAAAALAQSQREQTMQLVRLNLQTSRCGPGADRSRSLASDIVDPADPSGVAARSLVRGARRERARSRPSRSPSSRRRRGRPEVRAVGRRRPDVLVSRSGAVGQRPTSARSAAIGATLRERLTSTATATSCSPRRGPRRTPAQDQWPGFQPRGHADHAEAEGPSSGRSC